MRVRIDDIMIPDARARSRWTPEQKALLKGAVEKFGQLSDPVVRQLEDGKYELIDGESRLIEFKEAGMEECEVKIVTMKDKDVPIANIMMNIARGTQDPLGDSLAFNQAIEQGYTVEDLATMTNQSVTWVKLRVALLGLPEEYQEALEHGILKIGHISEALRLPDPNETCVALDLAVGQRITVKTLKNYVDQRVAELYAHELLTKKYGLQPPEETHNPRKTMRSTICLSHNGAVDIDAVTMPRICNDCWNMLKWICVNVGYGYDAQKKIHEALLLLNAAQQRATDIVLQDNIPQPTPQIPVAQPTPEAIIVPQGNVIKIPEGMPQEEIDKLSKALETAYSG